MFSLLLLLFLFCHNTVHTNTSPSGTNDQSTCSNGNDTQPDGSRQSGRSVACASSYDRVRLPTHLIPRKYHVQLLPIIEPGNFTSSGSVRIEMYCRQSATNITVHALQLLIDQQSIQVKDLSQGTTIAVRSYQYDDMAQFFIVHLNDTLQSGRLYEIKVDFVGELNSDLVGFYRSKYTNSQNVTKWLAVTQFEPTDARRAFPCFDEPALKAIFNVTLGRKSDMKAVSNMPLQYSQVNEITPNYFWDTFEPTPPMSTYLLAFLVSNFERITCDSAETTVQFGLWARPSVIRQGQYACSIGPTILAHFENYFETSFPLPKIDMAAIPDFQSGAMENWGLITFRETSLLYDSSQSSPADKQNVARTVAHELAHQWFGNLVTPSWWSELWLNEGFATYMQYVGVDIAEPEWHILSRFVTETQQNVMEVDCLKSSHQISIPIRWPDEIDAIFDGISYDKGAVIIRMMEHYLTKQTMSRGLARYLQEYKYTATNQDELWEILTEQAHEDGTLPRSKTVKDIMDTWTLQTGFPVITIIRNYTDNRLEIIQQKYLMSGEEEEIDSTVWKIPITYTHQSARNFSKTQTNAWLESHSLHLDNIPATSQDWLLANVQETGFYKVNYDRQNWIMLIDQLLEDHTQIGTINRAQIADDLFDLARSSHIGYDLLFRMVQYLPQETKYLPWDAALANLNYIDKQMSHDSLDYHVFCEFTLRLISGQYSRVGFPSGSSSESHLSRFHRYNIITWACRVGHVDCVTRSRRLYAQWMEQPNNTHILPTDIKDIVLCTAIRFGGQTEWEFAVTRYQQTQSASEKLKLLLALGCSEQPRLVRRYLDAMLRPDSWIRQQDMITVFISLGSSNAGFNETWSFLRLNWPIIHSHTAASAMSEQKILASFNDRLGTEQQLSELETFVTQYGSQLTVAHRQIQQLLEVTRNAVRWSDRSRQIVLHHMREYIRQFDREKKIRLN